MWRKADLHIHAAPNESCSDPVPPSELLDACSTAGLELIGIVGHDDVPDLDALQREARDRSIAVVPGLEISTDRGHLVALCPGDDGSAPLVDLCTRSGVTPDHQISLEAVVSVVRNERRPNGGRFADALVLVGAHVDR